jgi:hypothetical protein
MSFQASSKIMSLIRFVQRASILAGITFASFSVYGTSATADTPQFCVIAGNGKTACGTLKAVERACVTTESNSVVCGKFKSAKGGQEQEQRQETRQPVSGNSPRTVVNNVAFSSKGCSRSDTTVKCSFSMVNKGKEIDLCMGSSDAAITDSSGKTYKGSNIEAVGKSSSTICGGAKITPDIDYEAILTFDNIPAGVSKAQVLSFPFQGKTVNLRNITFLN